MKKKTWLTKKANAIVDAIARGCSYEQILSEGIAGTHRDIYNAAGEALAVQKNLHRPKQHFYSGCKKEKTWITTKSYEILKAIAHKYSYGQIIREEIAGNYQEICNAAGEALAVQNILHPRTCDGVRHFSAYQINIRKTHPRAYDKWTDQEDDQLRQLFESKASFEEIAKIHQRQPSGIHNRLATFGLVPAYTPPAKPSTQVAEKDVDDNDDAQL